MKKLLLLLTVITLFSCKNERAEAPNKKEIPEALKEKVSFRSGSRGNLVEELYQELVLNTPELQQLESDIDNLDTRETLDGYYSYNRKSIDFYASARNQAELIKDSITRKKILAFIQKSNNAYFEKSKELDKLSKTIIDKEASIEDSHAILKIILTTSIIVKYQNENVPKKKELENMIKREDNLVKRIQKQTPEY
ncbi:hypothetical protein [Flavobacterium sangjuense]|uniref:Uncharacterized protein n=1 Tax=Flavobacterium sangjuense TaxID=2518177 RepID=A0A4P7PVE3_9FLAO|nr:hypothetical protein [Flavobacterium sangjuense]QBZ98252.1 hypothetical protein GS03_01757 [Flavobacterium sangjuense]